MKNVIWTERAKNDVAAIAAMVAAYAGENSAVRYVREFGRLADLAAAHPNMGKPGLAQTRELYPIEGKYRLVYEIRDTDLVVLTVKPVKMLHHDI